MCNFHASLTALTTYTLRNHIYVPCAVPNFLELAPSVGKSHASSPSKAQSYQNVNLLHGPALSAFKKTPGGSKTYVDSYGKTHVSEHTIISNDHDKHNFNDPIQRQNVFLTALQ